ncbi:MAG TPA: cobyric acid synthase [Acidimicrobiales bacterium]|jgi:adenosylcobyric acid synthase|nr:cobyric acid synthase [Acidimicrobiales bacterium]
MKGGLLVAGTTSDAGKSMVTTGICRWLARRGVRVAPFKAQNMSNNSMVCPDGSEIGRAQWLQALAAGAAPEAAMNPVLLKPGSDSRSHVVLMGRPHGELSATDWTTGRSALAEAAFDAFTDLQSRYDVVIAEGAGSPTEINLRAGDFVNMGLARRVGLPVVVVGDIDRGGVLAAMFGTLALLSAADQAQVVGWVVNKFRGRVGLLEPGLESLQRVTGRPVLGVLPWLEGVWMDAEDALAIAGWSSRPPVTGPTLRIAVIRLPRVSNATDVDALASEVGVSVHVTADPAVVAAADLAVLPGSRATVDDLDWLRRFGLADALAARAKAGRPVLGICGGYQMLAKSIDDRIESGRGRVAGLGLLPTHVAFDEGKHLGTASGQWHGHPVNAFQIHHGVTVLDADDPDAEQLEPFLDGYRRDAVWGSTWHGTFESDGFRRAWLTEVAAQAQIAWQPAEQSVGFSDLRLAMLDRLADAVEDHLDTDRLLRIIEQGADSGLPFVPPGAP